MRLPAVLGLALLCGLACGDDQGESGAEHDAATGDADAAIGEPDAAQSGVIVFLNQGDAFAWDCSWYVPYVDWGPASYLDLTRPADTQTGDPGRSRIFCDKLADSDLSTEGAIWFKSWSDPNAPDTGAFYAAAEPILLEGNEEGYDVNATPPRVFEVGDVVGPDADWRTGEVSPPPQYWPGLQTAHLQDASHSSAPSQVFFMSGIIGIRFTAKGQVHYGFVELELVLDDRNLFRAEWNPVRWGYNIWPDTPLTIPP